ncbi:MAG: MmgE/PrpD family protein, partial [Betaproteobacteria bacterium]
MGAMMAAQPTIGDTLARFCVEQSCDAIPAPIREKARLHLLDSVGVALASASFEFAARAFAGFSRLGTGDYPVI